MTIEERKIILDFIKILSVVIQILSVVIQILSVFIQILSVLILRGGEERVKRGEFRGS
jgi:hypothetical protein